MIKAVRTLILAAGMVTVHCAAQAATYGVSRERAGWSGNYTEWTCGTTTAAATLLRLNAAASLPCAGGHPL